MADTDRLVFDCIDVAAERYAVAPTLAFRLRIADTGGRGVHGVTLHCQIRVQPRQRHYGDDEAGRLGDLFGEKERWGDTLQPLQFANVSANVPSFHGATEIELKVPCTYDTEVAYARYFHALTGGEIPMVLLFSGTVFHRDESGFAVEQIPWDSEAEYRLPVAVWRELMDLYFPNSAWLRLHRDTYDELARFKSSRALPTWESAIEALLAQVREGQI